jgi:uncharacterized protein YbcV (DUF1398 family)
MFTLEQIKSLHSKVKSGADFPNYFREMNELGVTHYTTFVKDGHSVYHGEEGYELISGVKYDTITISDNADSEQLKVDILNHQKGQSDYFQFIRQCAGNGVEKWEVCMETNTCTYLDKAGNKLLVEPIPG